MQMIHSNMLIDLWRIFVRMQWVIVGRIADTPQIARVRVNHLDAIIIIGCQAFEILKLFPHGNAPSPKWSKPLFDVRFKRLALRPLQSVCSGEVEISEPLCILINLRECKTSLISTASIRLSEFRFQVVYNIFIFKPSPTTHRLHRK